jgi:FkbM family methyltransferase
MIKLKIVGVPIIVVCYNNYIYVENTLKQIKKLNPTYYSNTIIMDNCSTCKDTIAFLNHVDVQVIRRESNEGPEIDRNKNSDVYNLLPSKFILTDPDLELNPNLPSNFIDVMVELSDKYKTEKIGFALDISDFGKMFQSDQYFSKKNIYDWEMIFWKNKIIDDKYELYKSNIDTTFCLYNKLGNVENHIRIAGDFTAKHLPWYTHSKYFSFYKLLSMYNQQTHISTIKKIFLSYVNDNFLNVTKGDEQFLVPKHNNQNIKFWQNHFSRWEEETFVVFDKYLDKNKIFIDIGAWIGTTALYGSRKSKHVYCIEADKKSFDDLSENMKNNCEKNYTLINKAIYEIDNICVNFGKNSFLKNSKLNDSTSHIQTNHKTKDDNYMIETITIESLISQYNINPNEISLIKVDIEGGEENILRQMYSIHKAHNINVYISFHYTWWVDKNLDRFEFLTDAQKTQIIKHPFCSILL